MAFEWKCCYLLLVLSFFFELRTEIKLFLEMVEKDAFVDFFKDKTWLLCLVCLADITEQLNKFNLRLQGPDTNILQFGDILRGFIKKIGNWNHRFNQVLKTLSGLESGLSLQTKQEITKYLRLLENKFEKYFYDLAEGSDDFSQNLYSVMIDIATIPEEVQDELLELRNDSAGREIFMTKSLLQFWSSILSSHPRLSTEALRVIVHLPTLIFLKADFLFSCTSNQRIATSWTRKTI